jgi:hypothetical protein
MAMMNNSTCLNCSQSHVAINRESIVHRLPIGPARYRVSGNHPSRRQASEDVGAPSRIPMPFAIRQTLI